MEGDSPSEEETKVAEKKPDNAKTAEIGLPKDSTKEIIIPDISGRSKIEPRSSPTKGLSVPKIVFGGEMTN